MGLARPTRARDVAGAAAASRPRAPYRASSRPTTEGRETPWAGEAMAGPVVPAPGMRPRPPVAMPAQRSAARVPARGGVATAPTEEVGGAMVIGDTSLSISARTSGVSRRSVSPKVGRRAKTTWRSFAKTGVVWARSCRTNGRGHSSGRSLSTTAQSGSDAAEGGVSGPRMGAKLLGAAIRSPAGIRPWRKRDVAAQAGSAAGSTAGSSAVWSGMAPGSPWRAARSTGLTSATTPKRGFGPSVETERGGRHAVRDAGGDQGALGSRR